MAIDQGREKGKNLFQALIVAALLGMKKTTTAKFKYFDHRGVSNVQNHWTAYRDAIIAISNHCHILVS